MKSNFHSVEICDRRTCLVADCVDFATKYNTRSRKFYRVAEKTLFCWNITIGPLHWNIKFGSSLNIGNGKKICMGKCCWMASLVIQQLFPIQILLIFLRFELPPNFIFERNRSQTCSSSTYLCLLFSFLVLTKCQVLNLMMGRSRDRVPTQIPCLHETCLREVNAFSR